MNSTFFKHYKANFLLALLVPLSIYTHFYFQQWQVPISVITVVTAILITIDKWLWRYKPFSFLFTIADFSGTYEGYLEYEYRTVDNEIKSGKLRHQKVIYQTGSILKIRSFTFCGDGTPSSHSESKVVMISKEEDDTYLLIYTYLNEGNPKLQYAPYYGTEVIKFIEKEGKKMFSGYYYTDRQPQTRGRFLDLNHTSNKLHHPF